MLRLAMRLSTFLVAVSLTACAATENLFSPDDPFVSGHQGEVISVADGDTITVDLGGREERVRLLGVDAPESSTQRYGEVECGGKQAKAAMLKLMYSAPIDSDDDGLVDRAGGTAKTVLLTPDPSQDEYDKYGRMLAYVMIKGQKTTVQERLLADGWLDVYVFEKPFTRLPEFQDAQAEAKSNDRGVYRICDGDFHSSQG